MTRSSTESRHPKPIGGSDARETRTVPFSTAEFDPEAIFSLLDTAGRGRIALAVSGGGDSMALLVAAHLWARQREGIELLALTVDHALRPASAAEAQDVAAFCAARGIAHRTLVWSDAKPASGISAAARQARHALLARAALEAGIDTVLTGHTLDDQAETVVMRAARGAGRGEAGIAPATLFDNQVWFVRPLLETRRETLRDFLRAHGVGWAEDPSNGDMRYERARLRRSLSEAERRDAVERAAVQARARAELGRKAAVIIDANASHVAHGLFRLGMGFVEAEPQVALYALRILLAVIGGRPQLVEVGRAGALLGRLQQAGRLRATLSRCVIDRRANAIFLYREARDLPEIVLEEEPVVWDGRYRIAREGPLDTGRIVVEPAGNTIGGGQGPDSSAPPALVRAAARAEPCIRSASSAQNDIAPMASCVPLVAPWSRHLPFFDLAAARAVSRLIGGREIPPPPLARHNRVT